MHVNEKAQRLMLVTDIKFRMDEYGSIIESERKIDQSLIDQSMSMPDEEFKRRMDSSIRFNKYKDNLAVKACYIIEKKANAALTFSDYLDALEQVEIA